MRATKGELIANEIRAFFTHPPSVNNTDAVLKDIAKAINKAIDNSIEERTVRVKQLLGCLDYGKMTEFQRKVIELVELSLKN